MGFLEGIKRTHRDPYSRDRKKEAPAKIPPVGISKREPRDSRQIKLAALQILIYSRDTLLRRSESKGLFKRDSKVMLFNPRLGLLLARHVPFIPSLPFLGP